MEKSLLEDDLPVLIITEARPEGGETNTATNIWHSLPDDEGLDTVNPTLPEVSKCQTDPKSKTAYSTSVRDQTGERTLQ